MTGRVGVVLNMDRLLTIERECPGKARALVQKLAQDCEADMKQNMSPNSPSAPGAPPAVVTGNLKNSIVARPGEHDMQWIVNVGAEYGAPLEYGTNKMAARPFVLPSVHRIANSIPPGLLKDVVGDD